MSHSPSSTTVSTPPADTIHPDIPSPLQHPGPPPPPPLVQLTPQSKAHQCPNPLSHFSSTNPDQDNHYLDAAEAELLDEIQLLQTKLSESRHRNTLKRNRRLLRRNPSVSDSLLQLSNNPTAHPSHQNPSHPQSHSTTHNPSSRAPATDRASSRARIISVSFRLPKRTHRESARQQLFSAGLPPKALFSLHASSDYPFVWVGVPDPATAAAADAEPHTFELVYGQEHRAAWRPPSARANSHSTRKRGSRYVPVILPDETDLLANYEAFCEETLWPLLHYDYDAVGPSAESDDLWSAYRFVNQRFAEAISEIYEEGDLIWVHNYHLMLLPSLLRESLWYAKVGFFWYTPFPSAEIFRIVPRRTELLRGVVGADLIGFHSYDYSKQFVASCTRLLGIDGNPNWIEADPRTGRRCELGIYPGGIDVRALKNHVSSKQVKARIAELRARFEGRRIVVGVDRLDDCFTGIPLKLLAFEQLLQNHPELMGEVVLVEVAMLPKQGKSMASYRAQQIQVNELVGRINSSFGTLAFSPVHYINTEMPPAEVHALMSVGHVCVVSTVRDGMGLVPHEWTVCQHGTHKGPIVLSEFAGAAHSFATALHVNPWDVDDMAAKIKVALDMGAASRSTRNEAAYRFVTFHTASLWGCNFLEDLEQSDSAQVGNGSVVTPVLETASVLNGYLGSSAQPSPVSSSNVLSSMNSSFSQTGVSPRVQAEKLSGVLMNAFGTSPRLGGVSPDSHLPGNFGDLLATGDGIVMNSLTTPPDKIESSWISPEATRQLKKKKRSNLIIVDLDGTLVAYQAISKLGAPTQQVIDVLQALRDASTSNFILVVSSRDRNTVMQWLGDLNIFLAAEDGAFFKAPGGPWTPLFRDTSSFNYISHQPLNGQYSPTSGTSGDEAEQVGGVKENGMIATRSQVSASVNEPADLRPLSTEDNRDRRPSLGPPGSQHKGSAQSIMSLSNDASITSESAVLDWKSQIMPVMVHFAERTPGVVIEEGDASLTWHYADSDTDFGRWQARDLYKHLESFLLQRQNIDLVSEEGRRRWIKVLPQGVDKTLAVVKVLEHIRDFRHAHRDTQGGLFDETLSPSIDFVLCIGDDRADEGMFEFFRDQKGLDNLGVHCSPNRIFTCRVGSSTTAASWFLESPQRVLEVLEELAQCELPQS